MNKTHSLRNDVLPYVLQMLQQAIQTPSPTQQLQINTLGRYLDKVKAALARTGVVLEDQWSNYTDGSGSQTMKQMYGLDLPLDE